MASTALLRILNYQQQTIMILRIFLTVGMATFAFAKMYSQQPTTSLIVQKQAVIEKENANKSSLVKNLPFENIGPSVMSGRVTDLAVNPKTPSEFYVSYASGGLWYTNNNGTTFTPVMDNAPTQNVGEVTVDWKSGAIWVGTGENNASRSSYAGIGILKSTDKGTTWQNVGLPDSHHIGRILINPNNPDEVVVGVVGHLYSSNEERGVYKTTNGGNNWTKTLYVNTESGIIDIDHDPNNFNVMYASAWDKNRKAWHFEGSGSGSGIYKSTDGGSSWKKLNNFPTGNGVGRIGIAVYDKNTVYAVHDSQFRRKADKKNSKTPSSLTKDNFKNMSRETFLKLDNKKLTGFLKSNGFQKKYSAESVKEMVREGSAKPTDLATYLEAANTQVFDTPVKGAEVYRSDDGGKTWTKTHEGYLDDLYYSYGYYFGEINVNIQDKQDIYIYGVPILKSEDGGKTFTSISKENVHADHHALWINPKNEKHLINGNDGGVNITYDDGENWIKCNSESVGQFYSIQVDNQEPYNVYGGLQDNGVWVGVHNASENKSWHQNGHYPWTSIMGGDGMQIQIDSRNTNIVYTGYQYGKYFRINRDTDNVTYLKIKHELGESPYRYNWQTPILLSSHNQDILYIGANKLMRSMNQGEDWKAISPDLTKGPKEGNIIYGSLTTISESPFEFGVIYTGSDDGKIHLTKNGGANWKDLSSGLPQDLWVSRIVASEHKIGRVYATLNGYRQDNFKVYVYKSDNYGETWKNISSNIPVSPVNVVIEDPKKENIIYVGTDNGAYVSMNGGDTYHAFGDKLPAVAIHDIKIQKRENHLLLGTHGRGIYKTDITPIQSMKKNMSLQLFNVDSVTHSKHWGSNYNIWTEPFNPKIKIPYFTEYTGKLSLIIKNPKGEELQRIPITPSKGLGVITYDLTITEKGKKSIEKSNDELNIQKAKNGHYYLPKGEYTLVLESDRNAYTVKTILKIN